jgi:hypothetical protein
MQTGHHEIPPGTIHDRAAALHRGRQVLAMFIPRATRIPHLSPTGGLWVLFFVLVILALAILVRMPA